jgi:hypothetical protein
MGYHLDPIDKPGLLISVMRTFAGDTSQISLEGDLSEYSLSGLREATSQETPVLKRQTIDPVLDLLVAPLDEGNATVIAKAISRRGGLSDDSGLIHVQIAKDGRLVFGGYDNFHRECVFVEGLPLSELDSLKSRHVIRGFKVAKNDV